MSADEGKIGMCCLCGAYVHKSKSKIVRFAGDPVELCPDCFEYYELEEEAEDA
jgi:ribosome-binding protein aMBF1 (putative translation factor)